MLFFLPLSLSALSSQQSLLSALLWRAFRGEGAERRMFGLEPVFRDHLDRLHSVPACACFELSSLLQFNKVLPLLLSHGGRIKTTAILTRGF